LVQGHAQDSRLVGRLATTTPARRCAIHGR
jgi:hypothetical protein